MKARILVVDDEKSMQDLLRNALTLSGFDVAVAATDVEFRELVTVWKPHAIILDILLGDKDGIKVYEDLLEEGLNPDIPVIFLSALAHDRPPTYPSPGKRYSLIGKPFDCDELVHRIQKLVEFRVTQ